MGVVDFAGFPVVVVVDPEEDEEDPDEDDEDVPADDRDFGEVVVVVDFGRVVVVVLVGVDFDVEPEDFVVVVVVDGELFDPDGFVVVVVVDGEVDFVGDVAGDLGARGSGGVPRGDSVVEVVAAVGTLGSSLAVDSSRAWDGPEPGAPPGGATAGGGIFSSRRAYCMIRENTGADT